jgi:prophage regulatory protein
MVGIEKRLLRRTGVEEVTGLSKSEIYRKLREGSFPEPVVLADRVVRWVADEVQAWVADRIRERDNRPKNAEPPPHPIRAYWANHRAAKAAEESPAVTTEPPRKPRKPARPPPVTKTRHRANGHDHVVAARAAPVKAAAPPPKKRRGRPPTLSAAEKAERERARRQADREYRRAGREILKRRAAEREAVARPRGRPRRTAELTE